MLIELLPLPLLADISIGTILVILFLLFSFFGVINNAIKGNAGNQPQARRRPQRRGGELQNEIDDFLKEVLGDQRAQQRPQRGPQQREEVVFGDDDLELVEENDFQRQQHERERREQERREKERRQRERERQERERREQQRRKQETERRQREERRRKAAAAAPVVFEEETARPRKKLKDRHMKSTVESHVKTYMAHTVEQQHLDRGTVPPIVGDAGADYSDQSGIDQSSQIAQQLHAILKSQQGVRQAILVNEILSKPKGLRSHQG